ncbi:flagellar basal body rod protein FlgB [Vibrio sp. D431a]|uniref:flagellar basal body rod protein FlgB n=1 Tax=Vibrio sp. D431a TaxID=2837388 RepID=UPI002556AAA3|nr:flagellar basal body rod protein FlgB [Vibrio sp. D431a]MDK9793905.1 flagellar basal body rod protein FlgB [Vibrio sp. D431a]
MSAFDSINFMNAALQVREAQLATTAGNLANQDTPNFKAKGIDFQNALSKKLDTKTVGLITTDPRHIQASSVNNGIQTQFVNSGTIRADGNTVNSDLEKLKFAEYEVQYETALTFSQKKVDSLKRMLKENK